ncbi:MAG: terminase family protein [Chloroflexota bacterium]
MWLLRSGRGYGKTRVGSEWVISRAQAGYKRIALVGQTKGDVRDTMIEVGESSILQRSPPWFRPEYEPSKRRLTWPNGAVAMIYSGDEPGQLRGPQHDTAWVDEICKFDYADEAWNNLMLGLRIGKQPRVVVTTTPRPMRLLRDLIADPTTVDVRRSSYDNIANLSPVFVDQVLGRYQGTRLGRQEIEGDILEDAPGALWKRDWLDAGRVTALPPLQRIVVGVDPSATKGGDEAGIVVAGVGYIGKIAHLYVLEDKSLQASPDVWAKAVVSAYNVHAANRVIAETNNGGEMVELVIRQVNPSVAYKAVHASRGKQARAEPIAQLYEQGRAHHVGMFAQLEDECCQWEVGTGQPSPNRLDALVWAATELMLEGATARARVREY